MTAMQSIKSKVTQDVPMNFPLPLERFYHWEKKSPKKLFLSQPVGGGKIENYTWGRVADEVRRMAQYLISLQLPANSHIGILSKNCAHWVMSDLAIWMAGHISIPLYPTLNADTINQILTHSGTKVLFVGKLDEWDTMQPGVPETVQCISFPLSPNNDFPTWETIIREHLPISDSPVRAHEELSTIIYTSGTTGAPKGVMHTFGSMSAGAGNAATIYDIGTGDRLLSYLPLSHVAERVCVELLAIYQGFTIYFAETLETFSKDLQRASPTVFFAVPRIWTKFQMGVLKKIPQRKLNLLLRIPVIASLVRKKILKGLGLQNARFCITGAAPIPESLQQWYKKIGIELLEVYGMTENLAYSHSSRPGHSRSGYVGQNNPGVVTRISDQGEILIHSPCTMVGYYNDVEKTKEAITEDNFLRTGDCGEIDRQGRLKITGRIKDLFKTSKGKYVSPVPIESKLLSNNAIEQVCVVGANLPQPIALIVLSESTKKKISKNEGKEACIKALSGFLQELNTTLDAHERLKMLVLVEEEWTVENGIMTPTLKIKRNVLEAHYSDKIQSWSSSQEPVIFEA